MLAKENIISQVKEALYKLDQSVIALNEQKQILSGLYAELDRHEFIPLTLKDEKSNCKKYLYRLTNRNGGPIAIYDSYEAAKAQYDLICDNGYEIDYFIERIEKL